MEYSPLTQAEKEEVKKYFGKSPEELEANEFQELRKKLRAKYHPDNFEKFEDETIREMATDRFQSIEKLSEKLEHLLSNKGLLVSPGSDLTHPHAQFAFDKLKIEINTTDKDLKYHLFGTYYRWLIYGHSFKIPGTKASIIIDGDHRGHSIGYRESIRMYLSFGVNDAVEDIANWLYEKLKGRASSLILHGDIVGIDPNEILYSIKKTSFLQIGSGQKGEDQQ